MNTTTKSSSNITLNDRSTLHVCGVEDVLSFDENSVYLKTVLGNLSIDGRDLHVKNLSLENGDLDIAGRIDGLYYIDGEEKKKRGLFFRKS